MGRHVRGTDADRFCHWRNCFHHGSTTTFWFTNYEGSVPELTTQSTADGTILLANGAPFASLYGVTAFDVGTVNWLNAIQRSDGSDQLFSAFGGNLPIRAHPACSFIRLVHPP
jgi:hypothetical protein